jgi:hypothetical protein
MVLIGSIDLSGLVATSRLPGRPYFSRARKRQIVRRSQPGTLAESGAHRSATSPEGGGEGDLRAGPKLPQTIAARVRDKRFTTKTRRREDFWVDSIDRRNTIVGQRVRPDTDRAFASPVTSIAPCSVSSRTSRRCAPVPQPASWTRPARGALPEAGRLRGMVFLIPPRNAICVWDPDGLHTSRDNNTGSVPGIA